MPCRCAKPRDQRRAVELLELVELGAVDQPRDHLAHVVLLAHVGRHDAVELGCFVARLARRQQRDIDMFPDVEVRDDAARERKGVVIIDGIVIGDTGFARMHLGAAELFGRHHLAGRRLHQRRTAEEDRALIPHDDGFVRHRRHIGAARRARAHDHGDLRNAGGRQRRLVVEDAAEMIAVGKHLGLVRQVGASRVDEVDAGEPVFTRDLLRAHVLLHGQRIVGAAFDGGVVADDHAFAAFDPADAGDDAGGMDLVLIHAVGGERREFEERRARIDQRHHPLARQQFPARCVAFARARRSARRRFRPTMAEFLDQRSHARGIGAELVRVLVDGGEDLRHGVLGDYQRGIIWRRFN